MDDLTFLPIQSKLMYIKIHFV